MSVTIVATAGATDANSYSTVADADTYHEGHPYASTWDDATTDQKIRALVTATRLLDQHFAWIGEVASSDQALRWPRAAAYDRDGRQLANDTVPTVIADGTAELARALLVSDRTDTESSSGGIAYVTVGGIGVKYTEGSVSNPQVIPDAVRAMVSHLGRFDAGTGSGAVTLRRA